MPDSPLTRVESIVFPTRDIDGSLALWSAALGREASFRTDDFASLDAGDVSSGLTQAPGREEPVVFWSCDDIEEAHRALSAAGAGTTRSPPPVRWVMKRSISPSDFGPLRTA